MVDWRVGTEKDGLYRGFWLCLACNDSTWREKKNIGRHIKTDRHMRAVNYFDICSHYLRQGQHNSAIAMSAWRRTDLNHCYDIRPLNASTARERDARMTGPPSVTWYPTVWLMIPAMYGWYAAVQSESLVLTVPEIWLVIQWEIPPDVVSPLIWSPTRGERALSVWKVIYHEHMDLWTTHIVSHIWHSRATNAHQAGGQ